MANIHHQLVIGATAEKVYNAITTQEGLAGWWTPEATAKPAIDSVARFPFGPDYAKEMKIVELKPSALVKWNCIKGVDEWVGTNLSFQLHPGDKNTLSRSFPEVGGQIAQSKFETGTLLLFHHDDWKAYTTMYGECNYTWGQFMRSLKLYCETGKGRPWPNQHSVEQ